MLNTVFTWKNNWHTSCGYLDLRIWQTFSLKWMKWACCFKKDNWQHCCQWWIWASMWTLLEFWKTYTCQPELNSFPTLKAFIFFFRFHRNMLWMLTCNEFIVILKQINTYPLEFSILISNMINVGRYSSYKQMLFEVFDGFLCT